MSSEASIACSGLSIDSGSGVGQRGGVSDDVGASACCCGALLFSSAASSASAGLSTSIGSGVRGREAGGGERTGRGSAFGCGAFGNSAVDVANLYKQAIADFAEHLDTVVFAIFYAGHGANNYDIFLLVNF